jgi:hypothetical protein
MGHGRVKMTGAAGGQLNDRNAFCPDTIGITFRFNISFDNTDMYFPFQGFDGVFQQGCFAGTGAADEVKGDCAYFIEMFSVGSGQGVVCGKETGMHIYFFTVAMAMRLGMIVVMMIVVMV